MPFQDDIKLGPLVSLVEHELCNFYLVTVPKLVCHVLTTLQVRLFALTLHEVGEELDAACEVDEELQAARGAVLGRLSEDAAQHSESLGVVEETGRRLRAFRTHTKRKTGEYGDGYMHIAKTSWEEN